RVLDFGRYIAGPYCAALLADLGADVIRIERRGGGEDRWVAPVGADGAGAVDVGVNRDKRGMTLEPACPEGREIVRELGGPAAVAWVDCGTAAVGAFGTLAALMAREKSGRGQKVEGALLRTAVAFNNPTLVEQQVIRPNRLATMNRGQTSAPSDLFRTKDGW